MLGRIWQASRRALNLEHSPPHVFACSQWQHGTRPATFYLIYRYDKNLDSLYDLIDPSHSIDPLLFSRSIPAREGAHPSRWSDQLRNSLLALISRNCKTGLRYNPMEESARGSKIPMDQGERLNISITDALLLFSLYFLNLRWQWRYNVANIEQTRTKRFSCRL